MKGHIAAASPEEYIAKVDDARRADIQALHDLIRAEAPELAPVVSGGLLGYGPFHYRYASGREGDTTKLAVASNKQYISLYCCAADQDGYVAERFKERLPKASIGKACVRFKRLSDLDPDTLRELVRAAAAASWGT